MIRNFFLSLPILLFLASNAFCNLLEVNLLSSFYQYNVNAGAFSHLPFATQTVTGTETEVESVYVEAVVDGGLSYINATPFYVGAYSSGRGYAKVEASWLFQPKVAISKIDLIFDPNAFWSAFYASLYDETTGTELFSFLVDDFPPAFNSDHFSYDPEKPMLTTESDLFGEYYDHPPPSEVPIGDTWNLIYYNISHLSENLDPSHKYQLSMGACADSDDDSSHTGVGFTRFHVAPAPEPSTILLVGIGMVCLVGSRLRRKKSPKYFS